MLLQTNQQSTKEYMDEAEAILAEPGTNQAKIQLISNLWLPEDNANAVYIKRLADFGKADAADLLTPAEEGVAEAVAAQQLRQIKKVLDDLQNLNFYHFQYQMYAHYHRFLEEDGFPEHRVLLNAVNCEEFPVKDQARKWAIEWYKDIPRSFKEGKNLPAFELDHIETFCVVQDSYENELTKESSGRFMPPADFISDHAYWNRHTN